MGLRVLNVVEDGRFGGPHRRIIDVATRLRDEGIETTVLYPRKRSEAFERELQRRQIPCRALRMHGLRRAIPSVLEYALWFVPETCSVARAVRQGGFHMVHCNGSWQWKGLLAGKIAGARTIWHLNDTRENRFLGVAFRVLSRLTCDAYIVASSRILNRLPAHLRATRRIVEIQAPVDTEFFDAEKGSPNAELRQNSVAGWANIVTVGNVNPAKGLEYFIEMAAILNRRRDNLRYYIVGDWFAERRAYHESLVALCERLGVHNVSFVQGTTDVRPYLKGADLYVCSSVHEASPIAVWEAMSMARAIVSTDVGDVRRFLRDGEDGLVVPVRDATALAAGVERLLKDGVLREVFGGRARETAIQELDLKICARRHKELYEALMRGKG